MARPRKCSPEFRESAIRMVAQSGPDPKNASLASSASATESSCKWVRRLKSTGDGPRAPLLSVLLTGRYSNSPNCDS